MTKYFCSECEKITYSLRYMTKSVWHTIGFQWCNNCNKPKPTENCFKGLDELQQKSYKSSVDKKYPTIFYSTPAVQDLCTSFPREILQRHLAEARKEETRKLNSGSFSNV